MKRKMASLGLALLAAVASPAGAMYVNPLGTGELLLFPYFTVNAGQSTLLTVVNTTARAKMVKVIFKEGYNGRGVIDFNLALAPYDTWTATVFA